MSITKVGETVYRQFRILSRVGGVKSDPFDIVTETVPVKHVGLDGEMTRLSGKI